MEINSTKYFMRLILYKSPFLFPWSTNAYTTLNAQCTPLLHYWGKLFDNIALTSLSEMNAAYIGSENRRTFVWNSIWAWCSSKILRLAISLFPGLMCLRLWQTIHDSALFCAFYFPVFKALDNARGEARFLPCGYRSFQSLGLKTFVCLFVVLLFFNLVES